MKTTKLNIEFVQGTNRLNVSNVQIDSVKINEISGTIANRILTARANMKRYGMKVQGFSFNKKFDIVLSIDGCEAVNISDLFGGLFDAKITLQANAKSYERFANIIHDMTFNALTSENRNIVSIGELQAQKLIG
jgi:methionine salvage enolase-phosphatase E1